MSRPGVFLDRDGTIIDDPGYLADPAMVRMLPGAADAIARLSAADIPVVIVTNQSGIGRGLFTEMDYIAVRARVDTLITEAGGRVLATYHCPHSPDQTPSCDCRKPAASLFRRASSEYDIDLSRSVYIGDRMRDIEPGITFGGTGYLIGGSQSMEHGDLPSRIEIVDSLGQAVDRVLEAHGRGAF